MERQTLIDRQAEIEKTIQSLQDDLQKIKKEIISFDQETEKKEIEKHAFSIISTTDPESLTLGQLIYLSLQVFGIEKIPSRGYTTGDVSYHQYTDDEYRKKLLFHLQRCKFCHEMGHEVKGCSVLRETKCKICKRKGHTEKHCRDADSLQKIIQSKRF